MAEASHAVFLSYASQDAGAAKRIAEALRAGGIEVFLDQSELRGGDVWDQKIRREILDCALFMPVISANTASRHEGYFRLEWDLADQRSHMMARSRVFVVPVCLDATTEVAADVPESFRRAQWTRLPAGESSPAFIERVQRLLAPAMTPSQGPGNAPSEPAERSSASASKPRSQRLLLFGVALLLAGLVAYLVSEKPWIRKSAASPPSPVAGASSLAFSPPPHSIAVLPFVNMSGDKEQEYFSDGLTEEVLNSLAEINELQVAARTSAFSFKGTNTDIGTIGRKLNVGTVLEGSVRRSGNTVRITTQLINAVTGFHLWSHTYDRNLGDVLKLETEIAGAVAQALKVSLLGDVATKIELGGTRNVAAFDAYLRGRTADNAAHENKERDTAIAAYTEAIGLDPNYAVAYAFRSMARGENAIEADDMGSRESLAAEALTDARKALALAPELPDAHLALADYFENQLEFSNAVEAYEQALALAPGNARIVRARGLCLVLMGRTEAGLAAVRRGVALDPLSRRSHGTLAHSLYYARQYKETIAAAQDALALDPESRIPLGFLGLAYIEQGEFERARQSCERKPDYFLSEVCLVVIYDKLGRQADADGVFAKMRVRLGDAGAYQYAQIYAHRGDSAEALKWLQTAVRFRDPGLETMKTDPLFDSLRSNPGFRDIERRLKFPP